MKSSHGANLFEIQKEYGFNIDEIKDFSSNVNPLGPSPKAMTKLEENLNKVGVYPDPNYDQLLSSIEEYANVSRDKILLTSGSTNLISSFISLINPKNAIIFNPSYSEYERELKKINSNIISYDLDKSNDFSIDCEKLTRMIKENDVSLVILTNPNNPTGYAIENEKLKNLIKSSNCYFMIDETYVEFSDVDKYSAVKLTQSCDNLLVIRSTSKFFAAAGIRLGYGITGNKKLYDDINKHTNLWNINIFADILGGEMFTDTDYHKKVFEFINREKEKMISNLKKIDCLKVYPSKSNFVLCEILDKKMTAHELREKLIPYALIIRDCASFNNLNEYFFRFCILDEQSNDKLLKLIEDILK
ncbi:histidinol-phosphate transaminase [Finegoldia magna]|uniref:pyridoxal phosphate-dependent aminotransferase n=1 Tax=Finegoldia magna TaxID=1260 RepID=UPI00290C5E23|nr:histidinol-phosphate transaminase [Finegoldia magna]MDU4731322.1 histidinol-phosphate transaminase [Finegoldia magna]